MPFDEEELDPHGECAAEIARLLRCVSSIEDMLTRDPPRVGDALWYCEAAKIEKK